MRNQRGFTLTELIVIVGIIAILSGLISVNLLGVQHGSSLTSNVTQLLADIHHQRYLALSGVNGISAHGIHFDNQQYVLFDGATYNAGNPSNAVTTLPQNITLSDIGFPNGTVLFAAETGEIVGFASPSAVVSVMEVNSGRKQTIHLNALGTVVALDAL